MLSYCLKCKKKNTETIEPKVSGENIKIQKHFC